MEGFLPFFLVAVVFLQTCYAPPVTNEKAKEDESFALEDYMEYHRYLKEVISALESDSEFKQKLEKAEEKDIRNGKIAEELEFVSHHVRTRLDEIKRVELTRLRELTERKLKLLNKIDDEDPRHLDHSNQHTFEIEDLKKLIAKTTEDLAEADRKRKEEFKEYELQKEYDKQVKLNHTNGTEREKLEHEYKEREEKHKKHEKLHEPGHKAQLEEVWQEQDQMQQEFDPRTFFMLHDIDSNGLWDQDEVKALFIKELEKMYAAGEPEDDMRERTEEMERMRETVFQEVDLNKDGFIDYQEFLAQTKRNDFQQDHGWQGLDERRPYSDQELDEYIRQHQANQIPQGHPQHPGQMPPGGYQPPHPGYHANGAPVQPGYHPNGAPVQPQFHPGQVPQYPPQQLPGHLPELNTNEVYPQQVHQPGYQQVPHPNQQGGFQQHPNQQAGYQQHPNQQAGYQQQNPQAGYQQGGYQQQPNQQGGYQQQPKQQAAYQQHPNQPVNSQQAGYQQPNQHVNSQQQPNQQVNSQQQPNQQVNSQQPNQQFNSHQQPNQQAGGLQQPPQAQQNQIPVVNPPQGQNPQQIAEPKQNQQLNQNSNQGSPEVNRV